MSDELVRYENESDKQYMNRICSNKDVYGLTWNEVTDVLNESIGEQWGESKYRKWYYAFSEGIEHAKNERESELQDELDGIKYKETTEILANGVQKSDKLVKMSLEQSKDVNYLLEAHGFDNKTWELTSAKNNIWNVNSKLQGVQTLYSSKITVKPKVNGFDIDTFIDKAIGKVKPITIKQPKSTDEHENLLEIPLFDLHFGIADLEYYKLTIERISNKIKSRKWDKVLFVIGQDLLHTDGFEGKTTSGTIIGQVDLEKAWQDAESMYSHLIELALLQAKSVDMIFSNGNHDKGISFGFAKTIEAKYPQLNSETTMKQRKGYTYNDVFLVFHHGDKGAARVEKNIYAEFGKEIALATVVESHSGHLHHEKSKDNLGIVLRTLASGTKTDDYHYDNGFIGAHKRFQLFEFSKNALESIYYV